MTNPPLLLFDGNCSLCVQLAGFVERRGGGSITIQSWQDWQQQEDAANVGSESIGLVIDEELLIKDAAWARLVEIHPDMQGLNWLAEKLALKTALVAAVSGAAHFAKRLCKSCRLPWYIRD